MTRILCAVALLLCGGIMNLCAAAQPNIVVIMVDDLTPEIAARGSNIGRIAFGGATFTNAFTPTPQCSPSRTSYLTGRYAHNHLVRGNRSDIGGYETYDAFRVGDSTIFTWLQDAGYNTGYVGKLLNGWKLENSPEPGLNEWAMSEGLSYIGNRVNENGRIVPAGDGPASYATHVDTKYAVDFINRQKRGEPFFLTIATRGVHSGYGICPSEYAPQVAGRRYPRTPAFGTVSENAPSFLAALPQFTDEEVISIDEHHRERLCAFEAVDRLVGAVLDALQEKGFGPHTYVFFVSDHGFHQGEYGLLHGKSFAYDRDTRIPLYVAGSGTVPGAIYDFVLMSDLPATIAALAGVAIDEIEPSVDGRSFAALLFGEKPDGPPRNMFLISRYENETTVPGENPWPERMDAIRVMNPNILGVYTYETREWELYFVDLDPFMLKNRAAEFPGLIAELRRHMRNLRACHGSEEAACIDAENAELSSEHIPQVLLSKS